MQQSQRESDGGDTEEMAAAGGGAGGSSPSGTKTKKLKVAVIHPDLGIGKPPPFLLPVEPPDPRFPTCAVQFEAKISH